MRAIEYTGDVSDRHAIGVEARPGDMMGLSRTIRRALKSAGLLKRSYSDAQASQGRSQIDGLSPGSQPVIARALPGQFVERSYSNSAGTRTYKLYVPQSYDGKAMPLIVMLHGCTQSPDDFAAGTRMNQLADRYGFLVVYPAQSPAANGMRCWNWFSENDQRRDRGEPSLIAGITRQVASDYSVDGAQIFIAGLSAGGAMAVILGATYPELFAAVGVHSGLPYGAAHSAASTFAAMRGEGAPPAGTHAVPTIVFHGDKDATVSPSNGLIIADQAVANAAATHGPLASSGPERHRVNGREFTATTHQAASAQPIVEHWSVHGAGHAWSGGSSAGSFTDQSGPDASAEMIRFFLAQRQRSSARPTGTLD